MSSVQLHCAWRNSCASGPSSAWRRLSVKGVRSRYALSGHHAATWVMTTLSADICADRHRNIRA
eukprot:53766-Eustigmatos_ZCMA.PRE.1